MKQFCLDVIDSTRRRMLFQAPVAHFAAADALDDLRDVIAHLKERSIPAILDAKREMLVV